MLVGETNDTCSKDPTAPAAVNDDQDQDPPPPYTPQQSSPSVVPPPPPTSHDPPKPLCTCPRHADPDHPAGTTATDPTDPEGTDWGKVLRGTALVAVAAPVLAVAGAAVALPAIGFASTGVVGGSIAATIQSAVYGGATCGVFSVLQSVGATIAAPSLMSTAAAASAAAIGGAAIRDEVQKSGEGGEDTDGADGGGQDAAQVDCACVACVCDEDCECACRRQQRGA